MLVNLNNLRSEPDGHYLPIIIRNNPSDEYGVRSFRDSDMKMS